MNLVHMHRPVSKSRSQSPYQQGRRNPHFQNPTFCSNAFGIQNHYEISNQQNLERTQSQTKSNRSLIKYQNAICEKKSQQSFRKSSLQISEQNNNKYQNKQNYFSKKDQQIDSKISDQLQQGTQLIQTNYFKKYKSNFRIMDVVQQCQQEQIRYNNILKKEQYFMEQQQSQNESKSTFDQLNKKQLQKVIQIGEQENIKLEEQYKNVLKEKQNNYVKDWKNTEQYRKEQQSVNQKQNQQFKQQLELNVQQSKTEEQLKSNLKKFKEQCYLNGLKIQNETKKKQQQQEQLKILQQEIISQQQQQFQLIRQQEENLRNSKQQHNCFK